MAGIEIVLGSFGQAFNLPNPGVFPALIAFSFIGGTMGIVRGALGRNGGGISRKRK